MGPVMTPAAAPSLKQKLRDRSLTIGSWLSLASPDGAEMMARAGFEWLVIDMEHTGISMSDMLSLIRIVELAGIPPLVRVGANDALLIKRALDCGAHGVIVPQVSTREDAAAAVSAAYYPPKGNRGVGLFRAQHYGLDFPAYRDWAGAGTVVIAQIEHHHGVSNLDAILAVDGIDGFMIGPYDLSGSIGKPGAFDDPQVKAVFDRVAKAIPAASKPAGAHIVETSEAKLKEGIEAGYKMIAFGVDQLFLSRAVQSAANAALALKAKYGKA